MRISAKLLIPNLLSLSLVAVALLYLVFQISQDRARIEENTFQAEATSRVAAQLDDIEQDIVVNLLSFHYDHDPRHLGSISAAEAEHAQAVAELRRFMVTSRGRQLLADYLKSREAAAEMRGDLVAAVQQHDEEAVARAYRHWSIKDEQARARLDDLVAFKALALDRLLDDVAARRARTGRWVLFLAVFALGSILVSSLYYGRAIARPIVALTEVSNRIARGEVDTRIQFVDRRDELSLLARAFNEMADRLVGVNAELERKVQERTAELGEANEALRANLAELRRVQQSLLQAERLAAIGEMVTGLSHESRNALQRSLACLEMLGKRLKDNEQALRLLGEAQKAQSDLQQVYEGVRQYAGPLRLDRSVQDIGDVWQSAWDQTALLRQGRDASLVTQGEAVDRKCYVDPLRLAQVFRNLIENSLAACDDPVRIAFRCSDAALDGHPALHVVVEDNGPGLTREEQARLFEPFFTTKAKGTGLGMPIVKRIVEAHGGRVSAETANDRGLAVAILLPREAIR